MKCFQALNRARTMVRTGLHLIFMGLLMIIATLLVGGICIVIVNLPGGIGNPEPLLNIILVGTFIGVLAGGITCLIGLIWGLVTPDPTSKRWLMALLAGLALNIPVPVMFLFGINNVWLERLQASIPRANFFLSLLAEWLFLVNVAFFIHYLRASARFFGNDPLTRSLGHAAIVQYSWIALMLAFTAICLPNIRLQHVRNNHDPDMFVAAFGVIAIGVDLFYGLWLLVLVRRTRNAASEAFAEGMT